MKKKTLILLTMVALMVLPLSAKHKKEKELTLRTQDTTFVADCNPIVKYEYIGDPAAMVYDGTVYLYGGVDEAPFPKQEYHMNRWTVLSTKDMKTFTEHKTPLTVKDFPWCRGDAWASQVIERDGKFYWYVTVEGTKKNPGKCIAVAVSDSPVGPFKDALGKPLVTHQDTGSPRENMWWDDIDPTVFVDTIPQSDGTKKLQAYICWGNTNCYWAKLKDNMIELDGPIRKARFLPLGTTWNHLEPGTLKPLGTKEPVDSLEGGDRCIWNGNVYLGEDDPGANAGTPAGFKYTEAPWWHKRGDWYYLSFAMGWPEKLGYAMSKSIEGPWEFKGLLNELAGNSNTNHHGIFEFQGKWYVVYHNGAIPNGSGYRRSICLDRIYYNPDGTMKRMVMTSEGVNAPEAQVKE